MKLELKNSLSLKLLRVVLLSVLVVGVVLSCGQIIFDIHKTRQAVANDAQRILGMFRDPSTQAVYSLDREMGMQVVEGLFQHEAVRHAAIGHPNEPMLAERSRPLTESSTPWITDPILGKEQTFACAIFFLAQAFDALDKRIRVAGDQARHRLALAALPRLA